MNRTVSILALLTFFFSVLWLVFLVASMASTGPLDTFERVLAYVASPSLLFKLTYINAALVTLSAGAFFAALYLVVRTAMPTRAVVGLIFIPAYCAINLFVYLSQITVVPGLISALTQPESTAAARLLLSQLIQQWPASGAAFFNNLAYALLAIPSIIFGAALARHPGTLRAGGVLLALNGAACVLGVIGILANSALLSMGSLVGGVLFIAAMPFLFFGLRG